MKARHHVGAFLIVTHFLSGAAVAQSQDFGDGEAGAWHVVREVAPLLDRSYPSSDDILAVVRAELVLGRADRANAIMDEFAHVLDSTDLTTLGLHAETGLAAGDLEEAAQLFARAASMSEGSRRGAFHAQAGDAYERAGYPRLAAMHYTNAAKQLPAIGGWLAVREARVTDDPARAFKLLQRASPPARRAAALARAEVYLSAGDSARAVDAYARVNDHRAAAAIAVATGDSVRAQSELYTTLQSGDADNVVWAVAKIEEMFPPSNAEQLMRVARAYRTSDRRRAIELVDRVVALGDSSIATLVFLADLHRDAGAFPEALDAYLAARHRGSATAFYRYARLLDRAGRRTESRLALLEFADAYPRSSVAPISVFLVAEARRRQGRRTEADSLYRSITTRWPRAQYAGRSRLQLASNATTARDTAAAVTWYEEEIAVRGQQRLAARFLLARLRQATGDSTGALQELQALAREDSIGYYGTAAREVGNLPPPVFAPVEEVTSTAWVDAAFRQFDELRDARLAVELDEFVDHLMGLRDLEWRDMLALAEGLSERGWVVEGVRLGWRVAEQYTLNDSRVLRVIFPWPLRDLIERESRKHGLDPYLVAGLIRQESAFRPSVVSRAGAVGLMQLMPGTARDIARRSGVEWEREWDRVADANLHLGTTHLSGLLNRYGRQGPALAAYNAGGRPVAQWLRYPGAEDPYRFVERIPYVETRGYVRSVLRNQALYRALYPEALAPVTTQ